MGSRGRIGDRFIVRNAGTGNSSVDEAFRYCESLAYGHYENFPVASFLLPASKRKHIAAIYAFARTADDFADEPGPPREERLRSLDDWSRQLGLCYEGRAEHPVFVALRETVEVFQIPQDLPARLLKAFRSDVTTTRYETFEDVLAYCRNSADPVGRLVLRLFGYEDTALMALSDRICTALQLTNFWQDVTVDLEKDRVYLPLEDLRRFGVSEEDLRLRRVSPAFRELMAFEVDRTRALFEEGKPLLSAVGRNLRMELKLTWLGGMRMLRKVKDRGYDVLHRRPTLSRTDKINLFIRALIG